ncbi:MAG: type II toxin-antitoxin system VapC family toxin [Nitrosospira sp.]|nr:type II toxin-antitoxin system VapC family toxin [Nitrosospira sp.]
MIGLDTNVLVRYIMQDDPEQSPQASALIESLTAGNAGFITLVSAVELVWVLGACYGLGRRQLADALEALLRTRELILEHAEIVLRATSIYRGTKADFADCLIGEAAASAGCEQTVTFDRGAAKHTGMRLIQ